MIFTTMYRLRILPLLWLMVGIRSQQYFNINGQEEPQFSQGEPQNGLFQQGLSQSKHIQGVHNEQRTASRQGQVYNGKIANTPYEVWYKPGQKNSGFEVVQAQVERPLDTMPFGQQNNFHGGQQQALGQRPALTRTQGQFSQAQALPLLRNQGQTLQGQGARLPSNQGQLPQGQSQGPLLFGTQGHSPFSPGNTLGRNVGTPKLPFLNNSPNNQGGYNPRNKQGQRQGQYQSQGQPQGGTGRSYSEGTRSVIPIHHSNTGNNYPQPDNRQFNGNDQYSQQQNNNGQSFARDGFASVHKPSIGAFGRHQGSDSDMQDVESDCMKMVSDPRGQMDFGMMTQSCRSFRKWGEMMYQPVDWSPDNTILDWWKQLTIPPGSRTKQSFPISQVS